MNSPRSSELIGTLAASQLLGIDRSTFTRRVNAGKIPIAVKTIGAGGHTAAMLFDRTVIEELATTQAAA